MLLFKLYKYFFRKIENCKGPQYKESEKYFKYDLLIAAILYLFCTILFFYPCLKTINNSLIGPPEDNMGHFWDMWWAHKAVTEPGASLAFTDHIFYPEGTSLLYHAYSFYNLFLSFILTRFFNPITTYNLLILHTFLLSGIGAFLLIRYLTGNSYVSLIGGFVFAFNPSHFAHSLHHIEIASIQFIPFFVLFFIKAVKGDSKKDLFMACLFFFLNSICAWYYLVFAIYFIGFSYVYLMLRRKQFFLREFLLKAGIIVGVTFLILSPWLLRMAFIGLKYPHELVREGHNIDVADTFALFVPHPYHWLGQLRMVKSINWRFTGTAWEMTVYLGIINILIILSSFREVTRETAKYFLGLFSFLVLSMGSFLHVLGWITPIMLPYAIIQRVPLLSNAVCPSRAIVYVYLFLAVMIGFALKHLIGSHKSLVKRNCLAVSVMLLLFLDYYCVSSSMTMVHLPPCYNVIKREEKVFGILDLPDYYAANERYMMYQTYHHFPIVQGFIARKIGESLIDYLERKDLPKQRKQLIENKVKYIIIHKKLIHPHVQLTIKQYKEWYGVIDKIIEEYRKCYGVIYEDEENMTLRVY